MEAPSVYTQLSADAECPTGQGPICLKCPCESKKAEVFLFFFPFNPKHRVQLSLSFGDMNVASFTGIGLAVQCNLNNTNLSRLFRAW